MALSLPASWHDIDGSFNGSARIVQDVTDGDFDLVASFPVAQAWSNIQKAGLYVEGSGGSDEWVAAVRSSWQGDMFAQFRFTADGVGSHTEIAGGAAGRFVRLIRAGDLFTFLSSVDGWDWVQHAQTTFECTVAKLGVVVANSGDPVPAFTEHCGWVRDVSGDRPAPVFEDHFAGGSVSLATDVGGGEWRSRGYETSTGEIASVDEGYSDNSGSAWNLSPTEHPANNPFDVASSVLTITARRNPGGLTDSDDEPITNSWVTGYLVSNHLLGRMWTGGYFEWRMRCSNPARGMFPALWLYNNRPGRSDGKEGAEFDLFEVFGDSDGEPWAAGYHRRPDPGTSHNVDFYSSDIEAWHRYGVEWRKDRVVFYRDGLVYGQVDGSHVDWFVGATLGLRMNYGMDPQWLDPGDPDRSTAEDPGEGVEPRMEIDYVRVFERRPVVLPCGSGDPWHP